MIAPPSAPSRSGRVAWWAFPELLRRDVLSAQSDRLYSARCAWFRGGGIVTATVNQAQDTQRVLAAPEARFARARPLVRALRPVMGDGVFLARGDAWAAQRAALGPVLQAFTLPNALPCIEASVARSLADRDPASAAQVDLSGLATRLALDVVWRIVFGQPIAAATAARIRAAFDAYQAHTSLVDAPVLLGLPDWGAKPLAPRRFRAAKALAQVLDHALAGATSTPTLRALHAAGPGGRKAVQWQRDQIAVLVLAGYETTAQSLAWALWLLARSPVHQQRIAEEAEGLPPWPRVASPREVAALKHTGAAVRETLRLYPPLPMLVREARQDTVLSTGVLPRGGFAVVSLWHLHRHRRHWPRPDAFAPERWMDPAQAVARRAAYMPFGHGPRKCPGAGLAMGEVTLALARICAAATLTPSPGPDPVPEARLTLRGRNGLHACVGLKAPLTRAETTAP